ncbi:acid-sensing ion channel 2-like [Penaeus japonicus]|uniref:acid-sensing ion channel 2-like n=1 Tax=Penaeus japonicus TaxID=27405 RepID=UPI001C715180|nr:acid-sensing ion channel 2-like [Penaeus japonicus]
MPIHKDSRKMGNRHAKNKVNKRASRNQNKSASSIEYVSSELSLEHHLEPTPKSFETPREHDTFPPPYDTMYPKMTRSSPDGSEDVSEERDNRQEETKEEEKIEGRKLGRQLKQKMSRLGIAEARRIIGQAADMTQGVREAFRDFCNKTSAHGFSHVMEENLPLFLRVFWLVVTLTGLVLLISSTSEVTYSAFVVRRPTTEVVYRDMRSAGIRVPYITICSLSGFWKSKLERYNVSNSLASYILLAVRGTEVISSQLETDSKRKLLLKAELKDYLKEHNVTLGELVIMLSPTCKDVIIGCYSPNSGSYSEECCNDAFTHATVTTLGVCYSTLGMNNAFKGANLTQTIAGLMGGHRIIFSISTEEQMEYDPKVVSTTSLSEEGIHVSLSNFPVTPTVAANMQAVRIAPNTAASVALSVTTIDRKENYQEVWPWSTPTCITEEKFWQLSEEERAYTENNLYFAFYYRVCPHLHLNCTSLPFRFSQDQTRECMPWDVLHHKAMEKNMSQCVKDHLERHDYDKSEMCLSTSINQQQSFTTIIKEVLQDLEGKPIRPNLTVSMVNIYFSELGYTEYYERVPTFLTWFSDLGGQMGLFLGASFITIVEFYFALCYLLRVLLTKCFRAASQLFRDVPKKGGSQGA